MTLFTELTSEDGYNGSDDFNDLVAKFSWAGRVIGAHVGSNLDGTRLAQPVIPIHANAYGRCIYARESGVPPRPQTVVVSNEGQVVLLPGGSLERLVKGDQTAMIGPWGTAPCVGLVEIRDRA